MQTRKALQFIPQLNRKKKDPWEFVFSGDMPAAETDIQLFKYNKEDCLEQINVKLDDIQLYSGNEFNYWLNIYGLEPEVIAAICRRQNIHDLTIQDIHRRYLWHEFHQYAGTGLEIRLRWRMVADPADLRRHDPVPETQKMVLDHFVKFCAFVFLWQKQKKSRRGRLPER